VSRWSSPSDMDYWDEVEGRRVDGVERTCTECGEPHMCSRDEAQQIYVFHSWCLEAIRERHLARRQQMSGDAI
jgi:hypothetical protein